MTRLLPLAAAVVAAMLPLTVVAKAQDPIADFYRGKSIRFIIGAISGGGNDTYARLVGRHLGKFIPGNPTIVPVNMPGASGHVSAAHIYNVAARDGTVMGTTTPGVITEPLWAGEAGRAKYKYDPTRLIHLGSACIGRHDRRDSEWRPSSFVFGLQRSDQFVQHGFQPIQSFFRARLAGDRGRPQGGRDVERRRLLRQRRILPRRRFGVLSQRAGGPGEYA